MNVVLVDSGGANIGSVRYALERLGVQAAMSADGDVIRAADRVILPGVGAAGPAMARLNELQLVDTLRSLTQPLLGICLGMQLLFEDSEEGGVACLGLLAGRVRRMPESPGVRVPHMGWNRLQPTRPSSLLAGIADGAQAYFVHSFAAPVTDDCLARCGHGEDFAAVVQRGNVAGAQFHPERSAATGARLLENFLTTGLA
ncbi:MAG: imidazole glycerol phosphate synthase subunit HisH [Arenimonas sp.]|uniref:imidazole glycerol phosphate synthase subunit HisH n=1 Tax=Arenimonas sp. TaxID=1872635 RepID=UPI0025BCD898|nr:imidazole glycerol phosphate synthase subunit HisH [Arenimonas sp.]MBW8369114.1 imidazole glycerol phosphate synthase subunit HisH [Arenimonas sp.]